VDVEDRRLACHNRRVSGLSRKETAAAKQIANSALAELPRRLFAMTAGTVCLLMALRSEMNKLGERTVRKFDFSMNGDTTYHKVRWSGQLEDRQNASDVGERSRKERQGRM